MKNNLKTISRLQNVLDLSMFYSISMSPYSIQLQGELNHCNVVKIKSIDKRNRFQYNVTSIGSVEFIYRNIRIVLL